MSATVTVKPPTAAEIVEHVRAAFDGTTNNEDGTPRRHRLEDAWQEIDEVVDALWNVRSSASQD